LVRLFSKPLDVLAAPLRPRQPRLCIRPTAKLATWVPPIHRIPAPKRVQIRRVPIPERIGREESAGRGVVPARTRVGQAAHRLRERERLERGREREVDVVRGGGGGEEVEGGDVVGGERQRRSRGDGRDQRGDRREVGADLEDGAGRG